MPRLFHLPLVEPGVLLSLKAAKIERQALCLPLFFRSDWGQASARGACRGVSERQWRSAAPVSAPASVGAGRSPLGSSTRGGSRDQVLLPLPKNRRKHWVFAGFLFACVAWEWGSFWFGHWVFSSGLTRSQLFPSPPAPKTHPVSPFSAQTGCVSLFLSSFDLQNLRAGFCSLCRYVSQIKAVGDTM